LLVESLLESFLLAEGFLSSGWLFPDFLLVFPSCTQVVKRDMIVGGLVGLHLVTLLLLGDDDVVGVPAGVDDSAKVACGVVVEAAKLVLVLFWYALPVRGTLSVPKLMPLFLDIVFIFDLRSSHSVNSMYR
jgi:hypothetical protein